MSKVAFLGLGAMGSRMAAAQAGDELTVWNLTPEAANKLAAFRKQALRSWPKSKGSRVLLNATRFP